MTVMCAVPMRLELLDGFELYKHIRCQRKSRHAGAHVAKDFAVNGFVYKWGKGEPRHQRVLDCYRQGNLS